jgi:TRAP transporter 4TM/12TM fusion protein
MPWWDFLFAIIAAACFVWVLVENERMVTRMKYADPVLPLDLFFGTLAILSILEATRRTLGWILVITTGVFIAYAFVGPYIPGILAHAGTSYSMFMAHVYLSEEGMFNIMTGIASTFLFTFVAFGTFLRWSGVDKYYMDLCLAIAGKSRGGPAKVAVISSALMGTITGSTMSNVATTGALTIPMMKDTGFEAHEAAAIETASSTGGAIAPPIMGAGVFIMAEITGIPLITILIYSVVPAILYFASIYAFVEIKARKHGLKGLPGHQLPNLKSVLMKCIHLFIPLVVLVVLLIKGFTPFLASASCCVLTILMSMVRSDTRMGPIKILRALDDSARNMITITAVSACAALIMGVITLTGLLMKVTSIIIAASHGIVLLALFFLAAVSYVIGMGLPVTLSYILVSTLGAPALSELGVSLLAAHLAIFWYSQDSTITPPVCMTAFVAAQIAKAKSYMRVGLSTVKIAKGLYIIPLLFVYTPLLSDNPYLVLKVLVEGLLLFSVLAILFEGFFLRPLRWWEIAVLVIPLPLCTGALLTSGLNSLYFLLAAFIPVIIIGYRQWSLTSSSTATIKLQSHE